MISELMQFKPISLSLATRHAVFYQTRPDRCLVLKSLQFETDVSRFCMMPDAPRE